MHRERLKSPTNGHPPDLCFKAFLQRVLYTLPVIWLVVSLVFLLDSPRPWRPYPTNARRRRAAF